MSIGRLEISELKWSASSVCFTNLPRSLSHLLMLKDLFPQEPRFYSIWKYMVMISRTSVQFWKALLESNNFRFVPCSSEAKNVVICPRKFVKSFFFWKMRGRKIVVIFVVSAYEIIVIWQNFEKIDINPISFYTVWCEIHRWIRILNRKFYSAHAFFSTIDFTFDCTDLRGQIKLILYSLSSLVR